jgi:hypothetical protein
MRTKLLIATTLLLGSIIFFCKLPTPPPGPEDATVELAFELSTGFQDKKMSYTDSLGFQTKICMNLHLKQYLDSVVLLITDDLNYSEPFSFNSYPGTVSDAVLKQPVTLPAIGKYSVRLTGYVTGQQPRVATASLTIVDRKQIVSNQKPVLEVPALQKVGVGQTVMFKVTATDPDTNQKLKISVYKKPESATFQADSFKWSPVIADTGLYTAIFYVWDDGTPPISDTDSVLIVISPNPVNRAPVWVSQYVKDSAKVGVPFSYDLSNRCYDLDNEILTFALFAEPPLNDTIKGNAYTFTPATSDIGKHTVHITVRDTSGLEDTLILELTVTGNSDVDTKPPVFTRVKPENDSTTIHSSSYSVSVLCSDESKVDSVKCFVGTVPFDVTKTGDSLYTASVSGLLPDWNTVSFAARDASPAKNPGSFLVHIKYEKETVDKTPPVITFKSPSKDTIIGADSFEVKVSCVDDSGCSVKGYSDGTAFNLKKISDANLWSGMAKGIAAGSYSTIKIVATDSSFAKNKDSLTIKIKYDNDKSGPVVTFIKPAAKSTSTNSSTYSIEIKCTDASGVSSVKGISGKNTVPGVRSGDNWIVTMNNLALGDNKVIITAKDSSLLSNQTLDSITIKYDPTIDDADGPIIKQVGVPVSGSIVNSAIVEITDSISDNSGVDSVYWMHNNGPKKMMTLKSGLYYLKDTLREGVLDSLVIIATDSSSRKNPNRQVIVLTYILPPSITKQPVTQTVCSGAQAIFSVTAAGTGPLSYQWRTGAVAPFTNIGSNSPACTLSTSAATILSCVVSNQAASNATSNLCTLSVNVPAGTPAGKAAPDTITLGDNKTVTLSVTSGSPGTGGSWVWYASDKTTKVAANPFTPTASATYYVRSENAACGVGAWSSAVQVTVNQLPGTPTGKATPVSVCLGDNQTVTLSVVDGNPGTGGSWVWYASDKTTKFTTNPFTPSAAGISTYYVRSEGGVSGAGTWSAGVQVTVNQFPGAPTGTATPSSICSNNTQQVTLSATGTTGTGGSWVWYESDKTTKLAANPFTPTATKSYYVRSEGATCGVGPWNSAAVVVTVNNPPSISSQPTNTTTCSGTNATVSVTATGATGYQWYSGAVGNGTAISGATSSSYSTQNAGSYYCILTGNGCSVTSTAATVTVNTPPSISVQPANKSTCSGTNATVSVTATGATGYQWYRGAVGSGTAINGATSSSYSTLTAGSYYCILTGNGCSVTSTAATVTVNSPPSISISGAGTVCSGTDVTLYVTTGPGWSYQWTNTAGTQLSVQSNLPFSNIQTTHGGTYYCRVTDGNGCYSTASATLSVNAAPSAGTLSFTPSSTVCSGTNVRLTSSVSGGTSYTWYKSGSSTPVATTNNNYRDWIAGVNDGGSYTCVVTIGGCNSPATAPVQLNVNAAPVITAESNDVTQTCSDPVSYVGFTVNVQGTTGYTFQWAYSTNDTIPAGGRYYSWSSGSDWSTISCLSESSKQVKCLVWRNGCMVASRLFTLSVPDRSTCP